MRRSKLNDLNILSIESDLFNYLNSCDIINTFGKEEARNRYIRVTFLFQIVFLSFVRILCFGLV